MSLFSLLWPDGSSSFFGPQLLREAFLVHFNTSPKILSPCSPCSNIKFVYSLVFITIFNYLSFLSHQAVSSMREKNV
jgi:hypothetical protein